jgi:RHS repeat-associated protein
MLQPGRKYSAANGYRYGFNGKENDKDVKGDGNQYNYGFRIYDPRIGKFLSVDPLTPKYPELTPYQFASNRPIEGIDEDGLEYVSTKDENITSAEKNKDGTFTLKIGDLSVSASSVVSHNGQEYYNLGKILYKSDKGISEQGNKSQKITTFFVTENQLKDIFPHGNAAALSTLSTLLNKYMEDYGIKF